MSALSTRRYLSVWLRRLSIDRIERRLPAPADGPRVVVASVQSAQRLVALNDAAARLGLRPGMALADARAMYPALPVADAEPDADRRLLEAIADWCDRYTPLVGLDPPDGLALDITGCAHLFGGEAALARDLVTRLAHQGFAARAAVADTVGCAWAVARYGEFLQMRSHSSLRHPEVRAKRASKGDGPGIWGRSSFEARLRRAPQDDGEESVAEETCFIVPRGDTEAAVLPLPVMALRVDAKTATELAGVGLKCIADLAARPRAPLAARFGEALVRRLDRALGRDDEPISPRLPLPSAVAEQRFAEPVALEASVLGTIEHLAHQLASVLERRGEGARLVAVALFRTDGKVHRLEIGTGSPLREPARMRKLFEDRLAALGEACDPGFGYDVIRLSALVTERTDPVQAGFGGASDADRAEELAHLVDRLGARFGLNRVTRLVAQDTHIPELAAAAVPAHAARSMTGAFTLPPLALASGGEGRPPKLAQQAKADGVGGVASSFCPPPPPHPPTRFARGGRGEAAPAQDSLSPARPIRLFERAEAVEAIAEVPDGPPVRFRWRQVLHEVACAEGPERIAMQWWRDENGRALTRDYFRVESRAGARVWLYREGLYGRETERPRWYLHGLFA
jgi:protein ImuB